jgi:hypothetical protein
MSAEDRECERDDEQKIRRGARLPHELLHRGKAERQHHRRKAEREQQPNDVKRTEPVRDRAEQRGRLARAELPQQHEREEARVEQTQRGRQRECFPERDEEAEQRERMKDRGLLIREQRRARRGETIPERRFAAEQSVARDARPRRELREHDARVRALRYAAGRLPWIGREREVRRKVDFAREQRLAEVCGAKEREQARDARTHGREAAIPRDDGESRGGGEQQRRGQHASITALAPRALARAGLVLAFAA